LTTDECDVHDEEWTWLIVVIAFCAAMLAGIIIIVIICCKCCNRGRGNMMAVSDGNEMTTRGNANGTPQISDQNNSKNSGANDNKGFTPEEPAPVYAQVKPKNKTVKHDDANEVGGQNNSNTQAVVYSEVHKPQKTPVADTKEGFTSEQGDPVYANESQISGQNDASKTAGDKDPVYANA